MTPESQILNQDVEGPPEESISTLEPKAPLTTFIEPSTGLARDILKNIIVRFLSVSDWGRLGRVSHFFRGALWPILFPKAAQLFVNNLITGTQDLWAQAQRMVENNPQLLLAEVKEVIDPAGRIHQKVRGYEAVLGAGDSEAAEFLESQFTDTNLGVEKGLAKREQCRQYRNQLPFGWVDPGSVPTLKEMRVIDAVIQAITDALSQDIADALDRNVDADTPTNQTVLRQALDAFQAYFSVKGKVVTWKGKHINHRYEHYAWSEYSTVHEDWDGDQIKLFEREVLRTLQQCESGRVAQERAYGVISVLKDVESTPRITFFDSVNPKSHGLMLRREPTVSPYPFLPIRAGQFGINVYPDMLDQLLEFKEKKLRRSFVSDSFQDEPPPIAQFDRSRFLVAYSKPKDTASRLFDGVFKKTRAIAEALEKQTQEKQPGSDEDSDLEWGP